MKPFRLLLAPVLLAGFAALACASLPNFTVPSLSTATARAARTATIQAGGDYTLDSGLTVGALATLEKAVGANAPILESLAKEQYTSEELSQAGHTYTFTVALDKDQTLLWQTNWCTTTEAALKQNLDHMRVKFMAGDEVIYPGHIGAFQTRSGDLYCAYFMVSVSGWPKGESVLTIDVTFTDKINDGIADYPRGTHTYKYTVTLK